MRRLEQILNVEAMGVIPIQSTQASPSSRVTEENIKTSDPPEEPDFNYARLNMYKIIELGMESIEGALRVANESENPRAYEVLSGLLKNMADINRQLIVIGKDKEEVRVTRKSAILPNSQTGNVTNNTAVFVGSSSELNKLLKKKPEDE